MRNKNGWIPVDKKLPKTKDGIWSESVAVWYLDIENGDENYKDSEMYNYKLKKWGGINGISGNYDERYKAIYWKKSELLLKSIGPYK